QFLFNQDGNYKNRPKVVPTLLDSAEFNDLFGDVQLITPRLRPGYGSHDGNLKRAASIIRREVRERCFEGNAFSEDKAKALVSALLEKLRFVQIVLGDNLDPHQVFDSLNAQGVRLENKDLIRNIVFQRVADDPTTAESVYQGKWLPLEQDLDDRFDNYFFPFALVHRSAVTKSALLATLQIGRAHV